jgi:hypothetical protein
VRGGSEQAPAATAERAGAKRRCPLQPGSVTAGMQGAQATARQKGASAGGCCRHGCVSNYGNGNSKIAGYVINVVLEGLTVAG